MIHSAKPTVSPVANIVFCLFCLLDFKKWGRTDGRTNGRHVQKQWSLPAVTVGRPSGSINIKQEYTVIATGGTVGLAEWIIDDTNFFEFKL